MNRPSAPHDCASIAPYLTELFDGEADAQAAAAARAHLLSCQNCARLWLDWNQHRHILRNESVSAPPPTLLWRVLVACRASGSERSRIPQKPTPALSLHQLEVPLPGDLSAHILARTTRKKNRGAMLTPAVARNGPRWPAQRWSLMAAPALALWLLLLGRADFNAALAPPTPFDDALPLPEKSEVAKAHQPKISAAHPVKTAHVVATAAIAPVSPPTPTQRMVNSLPRYTVNTPYRARAVAPISRTQHVPRVTPIAMRRDRDELNQILTVALDATQRERAAIAVKPVALPASVARPLPVSRVEFTPRHTVSLLPSEAASRPRNAPLRNATLSLSALTSRPRVITSISARLRPASFSEQPGAPRARLALSSDVRPTPREVTDDRAQKLRVSRPASALPAVRMASLNTNDNNGPRIEELRSAVDDFRAAISDASGGDGWDG